MTNYNADTNITLLQAGMVHYMAKKKKLSDNNNEERMIHVRLSAETHRRVRVQAAERDVSIQKWVEEIIEQELERVDSKRNSEDK